MQDVFNPLAVPTVLTDQMIGSAYKTVRYVAENMEFVKHVSYYMPQLFIISGAIDNINSVVTNLDQINLVIPHLSQIDGIAADLTNVNAVGSNITAITTLNTNTAALLNSASTIAIFAASFGTVQAAIDGATAQKVLAQTAATAAAGSASNALDAFNQATAKATLAAGYANTASSFNDLAHAWAEGTLPGGSGTKSAKEWATVASSGLALKIANTRAEVKAFATIDTKKVIFDGSIWDFVTGDGSAFLAADTLGGVFLKATDTLATVGYWTRRFRGPVDPLMFGVTLDGVDRLTEFSAFIDFMIAFGVSGILPAGDITLSAQIIRDIGSKKFALRGLGSGISNLKFTGSTGGIQITFTNISGTTQITNQIVMSDFSCLTAVFLGGNAIKCIVSPLIASAVMPQVAIERIIIRGFDVTTHTWTNGIWLQDCWNSHVEKCFIKGKDDATDPFDMQSGISFQQCNDCHITGNHIYHAEYGINNSSAIASYGDGVLITDNRIVGVGYGILATCAVANEFVGITYNHINAYLGGIQCANVSFTPITGNLIFKTNLSNQNDWFGILLTGSTGCNQNRITLNQVSLPGAPVTASNWGVWLTSGSSDNQVANNIFNLAGAGQHFTGVFLQASANKNDIHGNHCDSSVTIPISIGSSAGNTNYIHDNWPHMEMQLMVANDPTPTVGNLIDGMTATANTSATSITNFDDAVTGQEFIILINDLFTSVINSGGIILKGGVNVTPATPGAAGGFMTFKRVLGATREVSRTF